MRSEGWVLPDGTCGLLTARQFRLSTAAALLAVFGFDVVSPLPVGLLYLFPIVLTFWSHDRWMPTATGSASAVLLMLGVATTPMQGIDFVVTMRLSGAAIFLGAGWVIANLR